MVVEPEGVDPSTLHTSSSRSPRPKRVQAPFEEIPDTHKYAGKRTGRALRSVKPPAAARQLVGRAAVGDSGLLRILAEFLHIARPVVYCEPPGPATGSWSCSCAFALTPLLCVLSCSGSIFGVQATLVGTMADMTSASYCALLFPSHLAPQGLA